MDIAQDIARIAQRCVQSNPVLVVGSGLSAAAGLPTMDALGKHLVATVVPVGTTEIDQWTLVRTALANGDSLEEALTNNNVDTALNDKVAQRTWELIHAADVSLFKALLGDTQLLPLSRLLNVLFASTRRTVDVVTPNYDRLCEYAANVAGFMHYTGFAPGYLSHREGGHPSVVFRNGQQSRTVRIWKVHGSVDWFSLPDKAVVSSPLVNNISSEMLPYLVTPGIEKHQKTHLEPFRTIMTEADRALDGASSYLAIGYGFRDAHIEPKLVERCRAGHASIVVIARTLTPDARAFLAGCQGLDYLAMEKSSTGTNVLTRDQPSGVEIKGADYWSLPSFVDLVS